jgi:hypothetical protein
MSRSVVAIITLWALAACGRDPILRKVDAESASPRAGAPGGAPAGVPGSGSVEPGGAGAVGVAGAPVAAGVAGAPGVGTPTPGVGTPALPPGDTPLGPDGKPLPGKAEPPAPGDPSVPPPGGALGDPTVPPPGGSIGVPSQAPPPGGTPGAPGQGGSQQGPTVAVSGLVTFPGWTKGKVEITAFDGDHGARSGGHPNVIGMGEIDRPGAFTVTVAAGAGKVYIEASVDEDGDGHPGPLDPQGHADRFPVTVGTDAVGGLTIPLARREPPPGGKGQDF